MVFKLKLPSPPLHPPSLIAMANYYSLFKPLDLAWFA